MDPFADDDSQAVEQPQQQQDDFYNEPSSSSHHEDEDFGNQGGNDDDVFASESAGHTQESDNYDFSSARESQSYYHSSGAEEQQHHQHDDVAPQVDEDAKFREWENKHYEDLGQKDQIEYAAIDEFRANGQAEGQKMLGERKDRVAKLHQVHLQEQKALQDDMSALAAGTNAWEVALKFVDLQSTADRRDVSRMKSILVRMKNEGTATA